MYRFGREPAGCLESFARDLQPDEALGALWLAGRLEMPALQEAAAARLREAVTTAGEAAIYMIVSTTTVVAGEVLHCQPVADRLGLAAANKL